MDEYAFYRDQLWTAPELLRMTNRPVNGTQKADVYSFAIILQEIIYRAAPYFIDVESPKCMHASNTFLISLKFSHFEACISVCRKIRSENLDPNSDGLSILLCCLSVHLSFLHVLSSCGINVLYTLSPQNVRLQGELSTAGKPVYTG